MGSYLKLNYELIGSGGKKYSFWDVGGRPELAFAVYQGDTQIDSGKFEFG